MRTIIVCVLALTALTGCAPEVRQEVARERARPAARGRAARRGGLALPLTRRGDRIRQRPAGCQTVRISLHAGPVYRMDDPFTGRANFWGFDINRAARLEPVTVAGHVYATQPFVALLTTEESVRAGFSAVCSAGK